MKWKLVGRDAIIIYFDDQISDESLACSLAIAAELERNAPSGLKDFIPAYTSVLLQFDTPLVEPLENLAATLTARFQKLGATALPELQVREIPVRYSGEDLARVAETAKLTPHEVVALHSKPLYRVAMLGFTPGFPYLSGLDPRLHTPRLATPRLKVKAGSIGIGGAQTGIYTVDGPGGWNIIGHTAAPIYDPSREDSFLLKQGDRVKFVPL